MTDSMGEKELLEAMRGWTMDGHRDNWREVDEQAHTQLKAIIKQHFNNTDKAYIEVLKNAVDRYQADSEPGVDEELERYWTKINYCFVGANSESECKDSVKRILKHLLQGKPQKRVTREWLGEKAVEPIKRFDGECSLTSLQTVGIMTVLCEKGDFEDLLQELGIEVIE